MRIRSDSFESRQPIPPEFALGTPDGFGGNRNPHLAWDEVPEGARAFALLCIDPDVPSVREMVNKDGVEIPAEQPRTEFSHWVVADIPADVREIAAGSCSDGPAKGGKRNPPGPAGARQGLNDYTKFFADDDAMGGEYFGYDGPYPPANDLRTHRYFFRLFALDLERLELPETFTAGDVFAAMHGHVLAEAAVYGTYALNPGAKG
ncbi:YbhB/YbcL family Raf kinase inhibitor-like protein [Luteimonas sp. R10]|uniref:YbhB/YbcL family Raf kinase inhibitor-like protein n=1 Tax=Luteimonas sp. R10 TaxID=3108176 RepID=UPI003091369E|nr:YbhB/YbcL family Raf kinase inhibitor-like protein [Luteimonas sp. R10]